jgi:hypothetical protein
VRQINDRRSIKLRRKRADQTLDYLVQILHPAPR